MYKLFRQICYGFIYRKLVLTEGVKLYEDLFQFFKCSDDSHECTKPACKRIIVSAMKNLPVLYKNIDLFNISSPFSGGGEKFSTSKKHTTSKALSDLASNNNRLLLFRRSFVLTYIQYIYTV